ncbi:ferredoxin [Streptomyces sp. NBC_00513]|uniref:ferredoxin n=1 Tax=Streptomyces sp. NBC_00424 TaxID=2903648 RepID=UPI00225736CC|nr:ferredoxin [Streptomyces sp. NBC_00424]MCX5071074.1 ferredoxin [Streptomyces sp. NBC_00424]WUD46168.1 ferredoxin [Streptomyces sp. NBC_00513]
MKVEVSPDLCCGAGMCALLAPEVFDQSDEGVVLLLDARPPAAVCAAVREAADQCPCTAITLHETPEAG